MSWILLVDRRLARSRLGRRSQNLRRFHAALAVRVHARDRRSAASCCSRMAMRQLPLGTAYAVWTGIGAVGAFVFGIVMMGEAVTRRAGRKRGADRDRA